MESIKPSRNHPNQKIFIVFYRESYDDEAMRGLAHEEQKENKERLKNTANSGAHILYSGVILLQMVRAAI